MTTPPEPTVEELKRRIAELTAENTQLKTDKTKLAAERDKALLGWRPTDFYDLQGRAADDPFLTRSWQALTPDTRPPAYPTVFTGTFNGTQAGPTPAITFTWKKPAAGAPASYELQRHEGEIDVNPSDPSRVFLFQLPGDLTTYKLDLTGHKIRARQYRFTLTAIDASGRRSTPAIAVVAA
ncbi:bZIP transcription factor [Streptomyces rimosus]|uniref:bZIP transcription factor n=1 Tax=Streptomyces rimosus TaxID=1927 RepID=UPI0004C4CB5B|nr:bZIP transcription factor [Streptomyces rimosus]